jgi:hypothetical protein
MDYCHWYSWQVDHQLWICIFHYLWGPWILQNVCKVDAKAASRWEQMGTHGNVYAICTVILWRRGFPAMDCHRWQNMGAPLWTCKQMSKVWSGNVCYPGPRNSVKVMLMLFWDFNATILSKCRGMLTIGVVLHSTSRGSRDHWKGSKTENQVSPHPAHSSDLIPHEYYIFVFIYVL